MSTPLIIISIVFYTVISSLRSCVERSEARLPVHFFGDANLAKYFRALVTQFTPSGEYMLPEDLEKVILLLINELLFNFL